MGPLLVELRHFPTPHGVRPAADTTEDCLALDVLTGMSMRLDNSVGGKHLAEMIRGLYGAASAALSCRAGTKTCATFT